MAVATFTIVPVRLILMSIFTLLAWITANIALIGITQEDLAKKPLTSGWRL